MFEAAPVISKEPNENTAKVIDMVDILMKVQDDLCNPHAMCKHIVAGTKSEYLVDVIGQIVMDMTIIPVARRELGLENVDDASTVSNGFHRIAGILADVFNEEQATIEQKMLETMNSFPVDDVREAYVHRSNGTLH